MAQWNFNCNNCIYSINGMACHRTACSHTPPTITYSTHTMKQPTEKQIKFAEAIADCLHLPEPDYNDYNAVSAFIANNKDNYYQRKYDNNEI